MKQRISTEQVLGLSERAKEKLIRILGITGNSGIDCPEKMIEALRLNIGQMIEFLRDHIKVTVLEAEGDEPYRVEEGELYPMSGINFSQDNYDEKKGVNSSHPEYKNWNFFLDDDLTVDNLWESVKQILEKE